MKRKRTGFEGRRARAGFLFVLPFVIGLLLFFIKPLCDTIWYSFANLSVNYETGFQTTFQGLRYYREMLTVQPDFLLNLQAVLTEVLYRVPMVVIFSTFAAVMLNRQFAGRGFFRAVFFLPVIIMSGALISVLSADTVSSSVMGDSSGGNEVLNMTVLQEILSALPIGSSIVSFLTTAVNSLVDISWYSGIQVLLILAGLQNIPGTLYEAAKIEGANAWSCFWKITFPGCKPMLFMTVVYTIIDYFTSSNNVMIKLIRDEAFSNFKYSYASALSVGYSLIILLIVGAILLLFGRNYVSSSQE
ncbi:MAG: sugar ABC transporter permease [Clostridia bacterium]|nr:sugar ABC transporter permease [Clostridia bacterium]